MAEGYKSLEFGEQINPGYSIKIERGVSCEGADISDLAALPLEELWAMREKSVHGEGVVFGIVQAAVSEWQDQAAVTQRIDRAIEYVRTPAVEHTANQWQAGDDGIRRISNMVYAMSCKLEDNTQWNVWKAGGIKTTWTAQWDVCLNSPTSRRLEHIAGQKKVCDTKEAAEKYLQGRIRAYAHLFTEISPPIPPEHAEKFMVNGLPLPGYTIEGQEPQRTEKAAAKVSEGGLLTPKEQKPSVLGQLAGAKTQERAAPAAAVPGKGREPEI